MSGALVLFLVAWFGIGADLSRPFHAQGRSSACVRTASLMFRACLLEAREEVNITIANCMNISDDAERMACRAEARDARGEEKESCFDQRDARVGVCELLKEDRYDRDPLLDPTISFVDPDDIDAISANPYVSLVAGHTYVLRAGEEGEETVIIHVTDETREISGVLCRVVVDIVLEVENEDREGDGIEYEPVEVTDDWFAQDEMRNVYYCGELSREIEDGLLTSLDGLFESGKEFAKAGTVIRAFPAVGDADRQEYALEQAEDVVEYIDLAAIPTAEMDGENPLFPCAPAGGCLQTRDLTALEPADSEFKFYLEGVGFVLAVALVDGEVTGEREELLCVGDSLEILEDESCEIDDLEALLEVLCELSPDAFCDDEEE